MTINDASFSNLKYAIAGLKEAEINDYVIIGGWCAFLNRNDKCHPGTIDVDILFKEGHKPYNLRKYIEIMRGKGYFTSAKHHFQLLNIFEVDNEKFCFNIDLLHTGSDQQNSELFVDQLDLNVLLNDEIGTTVKMLSIVQKESKIIFDKCLYGEWILDDGVRMNLIDYTGLFITKTKSCQIEKRDRDSYDIYLGFENNLIDVEKLKCICKGNHAVNSHVQKFKNFIMDEKTKALFDSRTRKFRANIETSPSAFVLEKIKEIT